MANWPIVLPANISCSMPICDRICEKGPFRSKVLVQGETHAKLPIYAITDFCIIGIYSVSHIFWPSVNPYCFPASKTRTEYFNCHFVYVWSRPEIIVPSRKNGQLPFFWHIVVKLVRMCKHVLRGFRMRRVRIRAWN